MGAMSVLQAVIATILIFVLAFGVGFILNMLLKTTWFPVFLYAATVVGLGVYWAWGPGTLLENLLKYTVADYTPFVGGLAGAVLSGAAIRSLRRRGYRMF